MISVKRQEFEDGTRFGAKTYDVKLVSQILKAVKIRDNATFYCTKKGIKITVEDRKVLQANAYLEVSLFDEYKITRKGNEKCVKFTINLSVVLDCLNILVNSSATSGVVTALLMSIQDDGHPMKLLMEHNGIITDCLIKTLAGDPVLNFDFESSKVINKIVFFSDSFKEVLNILDTNSDILNISMSAEPKKFKVITKGNGLTSAIDIPCNSELVDSFCCNFPSEYSYKLSHLKPALRYLPGSLKVSIQSNPDGIFCLQYVIIDDAGRNNFVEYFCSPIFRKPNINDSNNKISNVEESI